MTDTDRELRTTSAARMEVRAGRAGRPEKLSGRAVVYNKWSLDLGGFTEMWLPGSLSAVLREKRDDVYADLNHNPDNLLGRVSAGTLQIKDGPDGLDYVIDPLPDTTIAKDVAENVRLGNISGNSFTFAVAEGGDSWTKDDNGRPLRTVHEASRFWSLGPVVTPAFPEGTTVSARSLRLARRLTDGCDDDNRSVGDDLARQTRLARARQSALEAKWGVFQDDDDFEDY